MKSANEILTSTKKFHISLGLQRVAKILSLLGNPQEQYKCFHIAGTNGKGSTCKIINDILVENFKNTNIKTGLFTSPHLYSYTERIKINNKDISEKEFDELVNYIDNFAKNNEVELTEFEIITVVAFYYFFLKKVSYVILETGLGGLLDATNIIKHPIACVITTIDFDHTERLGKTIDGIAIQKAGIIKKDSNVIVSPENAGYGVILNKVKENLALLKDIPKVKIIKNNNMNFAEVLWKDKKNIYKFNLLGNHQADNLALALGAIYSSNININESAIKESLEKINWKFRLEYNENKNILIDSAHNPSGVTVLRNFLDDNFKNVRKTFIFGCLKNKDYPKMLELLLKDDDEFYFFEFDYPNSLRYNELDEKYKKYAIKITEPKEVSEIINSKTNLKIICGSIYMLGKLKSIF